MRDAKHRRRGPLTVARILAGSDRAELVTRAGEVAQHPDTRSMLLIWQEGDDIRWRNAGMDSATIVFAAEVMKQEVFHSAD